MRRNKKLTGFRDLIVWQLASDFSKEIYKLVQNFPRSERYSLSDDLLRAARSIPANIAEGAARQTKKEFIQFLCIARGSISEIDTHLEIAKNLGYLAGSAVKDLDIKMGGVDKMLNGLIKALKS